MEAKPVKAGMQPASEDAQHHQSTPVSKIILVASIAAGIQFGWALQLSLLTPYVQLLGVPHTWASFIWLCGPISGMLIQPTVGYYSDHCNSQWGRRRPFIIAGTTLVTLAVILIGFAADIGKSAGDPPDKVPKVRAVVVFVVGFWILDVANNMMQGPCRALLADMSGHNHKKTRTANSYFSFFMAVGNVLGYAAGSYSDIYKFFPFTKTNACDVYCANLKTCFIFAIVLLLVLTTAAMTLVKERPPVLTHQYNGDQDEEEVSMPFFGQIFSALGNLSRSMWMLILVTCLNWLAWFGFLLFDTDWMGKEVYGGTVKGKESRLYDKGVHAGSLGLMLNSLVLGLMSLAIEPAARLMGGVKRVWGIGNFILAICLGLTVAVTKMAQSSRHEAAAEGRSLMPPANVKIFAWTIFALLGIPQAITYSIPFALASIYSNTSGAGQGLSQGVLNLAIVIPQILVSAVSGLLDDLFGGGNLPVFVAGAIAAAASGVFALTILPAPPAQPSTL
ncbi:hypothetical protein PVL29_024279 [Vitis rotundifolia]|uniref:Sucrose transporter n=1 Tax=Vitis rotundifolia TaxID=103349 RepID=A0AA38YRJ8_VITRO|nr:hypothetical protein PVL29_024279 [Vitis rotundifolia]